MSRLPILTWQQVTTALKRAGFVIMGRVFTQINKREGTVDGTGLSQHILRLSPQQGDLQDAL